MLTEGFLPLSTQLFAATMDKILTTETFRFALLCQAAGNKLQSKGNVCSNMVSRYLGTAIKIPP
jgi:hypothetical protein